MKPKSLLKDESGVALVIALVMIIVLTTIGLAATFTSTIEVALSGNKRGSTDAFYAADSGAEVVMARVENFNSSKYDPTTKKYDPFTDSKNVNPTKAEVIIENDTSYEGPPRGLGISATNFEFKYYLIESTGKDQISLGPNRSTCTIEEKVVRLLPTLQGGY